MSIKDIYESRLKLNLNDRKELQELMKKILTASDEAIQAFDSSILDYYVGGDHPHKGMSGLSIQLTKNNMPQRQEELIKYNYKNLRFARLAPNWHKYCMLMMQPNKNKDK